MDRGLLTGAWLPQFGAVDVQAPDVVQVGATSPVGSVFHAEVHHGGVLGADFRYSAVLDGEWTRPDLSGHLQFRISDEGRYGVQVQAGLVTLYSFLLRERSCSDRPGVIAHCPLWGDDPLTDLPVEEPLASGRFESRGGPLRVLVEAVGARLAVSFGTVGVELKRIEAAEGSLGVGGFGVYVRSGEQSGQVVFRDLVATTDPTAASNFALLYSTPGYDVAGSKRLLVRTLNEVQAADVDVARCSFSVVDAAGTTRIRDRGFQPPGGGRALTRSLGVQLLEGDFSDLRDTGTFTLEARIATPGGVRQLSSAPFEVRSRLVSETMLWPLTIANAQARRAADDDFRRNWHIESGPQCWSVGLDGAFVADRADDQAGATLRRIFNIANAPIETLNIIDFRFVCRITIVHGCDAQLQFRITPTQRWAVTLQAGDAGGCTHGTGPGAVRLHREGPGVNHPDHFEAVQSHRLDATPFQVGRAYDVEVRAIGNRIEVLLDGVGVIDFTDSTGPTAPGGFALKAWSSTVRFGHAKVWARPVALSRPAPGVWIPYDPATGLSSQGFVITARDNDHIITGPPNPHDVLFPLAAQQHGFNDCNNSIGEVTSHSVFLAGLMAVWRSRAAQAGPREQDILREAILTAVLYLNELYEQGNRSGAFAHQEPGRGALDVSKKVLTTQFALYGLSSFAAAGLAVDARQAGRAFELAVEAWNWLDGHGGGRDATVDSVAAIRLALAAQRQGRSAGEWFERAHDNSKRVLDLFAEPGAMANAMRPTLRSVPWFEGVYETFTAGPIPLDDSARSQLAGIADQLEALMNDPANAFRIVPQSDDERRPPDPAQPARNWNDLADLPLAAKPIPTPPVGDWYLCEHFVTAAADCTYIGRLTDRSALEQLATGNLYWALGLNPGIPTTKTVRSTARSGSWGAASFVYNGPGAFARTIEGFRAGTTAAKGWLATWEDSTGSRHRETWWFDPAQTGFQTIVNGHVLREGQWHYWSIGVAGWVSGETFMLIDGSFVRAALAIEDWRTASVTATATPYDLSRLRFFDTTHLDRASTRSVFDDPDVTDWPHAQRMATDFAAGKGYAGARPTGHHVGERVGVLCLPTAATTSLNIHLDEIAATQFPFRDIAGTHWAQIGRAAVEIAAKRGFATGYFTGHQEQQACAWVGIQPEIATIFDVADDDPDVTNSPWRFPDVNTVHWAQAARLATDVCIAKGFAGGFFTGHQIPGRRQIAALRSP